MAMRIQMTIDCADPGALAPFWAQALGYQVQDPPEGFDSWPDALRAWGVPESEWNSASAVVDPDGAGPRIFFQRVPEAKTVKNRLHLDVLVHDVEAATVQAQALGARRVGAVHQDRAGSFQVLLDPEGNEWCVVKPA